MTAIFLFQDISRNFFVLLLGKYGICGEKTYTTSS